MIHSPGRYQGVPGNADRVYDALCKVLSGRRGAVDWASFSAEEWDLLPRMAGVEGVGPLVYWQFKQVGWPEGCPAETVAGLMGQFFMTGQQNKLMFEELARIQSAFREANMDTILLKGAAMAIGYYKNIGLRPMGDLDLLVRMDLLERGEAAVRSLGYEPEKPLLRSHHLLTNELNFVGGEKTRLIVELHWNLVGPDKAFYSSKVDLFSRGLEPLQVNGFTAYTLKPAAAFLYQAGHLVLKHGKEQQRLLWDYDLMAILKNANESIWKEIVDLAKVHGWEPMVTKVIEKLKAQFSFSVDEDILVQLSGNRSEKSIKFAALLAKRENSRRSGGRHIMETWPYLSWRERLLLVTALVFPNKDFIRWRYQSKWDLPALLYYPYHWLCLFKSGIRFITRQIRKQINL